MLHGQVGCKHIMIQRREVVKKIFFVVLSIIVVLFIIQNPSQAQTQTLELTTYYPAPFGAYDRIKLVPRPAGAELTDPCDSGTLYVSDDGNLNYCEPSAAGSPTGTFGPAAGEWERAVNNNDIYPIDTATNPDIKIGIGTITPTQQLHIVSDNSVAGILVEAENDNATIIVQGQTGANGSVFSVTADQTETNIGTVTDTPINFITGDPGTGGGSRLTITDQGQVGIGTTTPARDLEVAGGFEVSSSTGAADIVFDGTTGAAANVQFRAGTNLDGNFEIDLVGNAGDPYFVVTPGGDVEINGTLSVKNAGEPVAEVQVEYVADGTNPGYYATYAP